MDLMIERFKTVASTWIDGCREAGSGEENGGRGGHHHNLTHSHVNKYVHLCCVRFAHLLRTGHMQAVQFGTIV